MVSGKDVLRESCPPNGEMSKSPFTHWQRGCYRLHNSNLKVDVLWVLTAPQIGQRRVKMNNENLTSRPPGGPHIVSPGPGLQS
jgi:hypothetical protein